MMRRLFTFSIGVLILSTNAAILSGEAKPNFTGEWKLNGGKSDFGRLPPPANIVRKIEHKDPELKLNTTITSTQGDVSTSYTYTTDGKEAVNQVRGVEVKGTAKWEGNHLVFDTERPLPKGGSIKTQEKWVLSEDGKTLMWISKMAMPQGDLTTTAVLDKQ